MSDKYDRQVRLWASTGQKRLQFSHVCLLNCTSVGAEVLKNLVLPGIGEFTIVDGDTVRESDLDGNFFLDPDSVGQPRCSSVCRSLQELNSDVQGHFRDISVQSLVEDRAKCSDFLAQFSAVVLGGPVPVKVMMELKSVLWEYQIPFFVVSTVGFYGMVRVYSKETTIIETHDPSKTYDLRIDQPWPELQDFADSFDLESLDATDHAHVPFVVIFIKALHRWKLDYSKGPLNYTEKSRFQREYIQGMSRNLMKEPNFIEASSSFHRALQVTNVPETVQRLFERIEIQEIGPHTSVFWLLVHALSCFTDINGCLPLSGNLPDMTSTTADYVRLQEIYRDKAQRDQKQFTALLRETFQVVGRSMDDISNSTVSVFCKNSAFLHVTSGEMSDYTHQTVNQLLQKLRDDINDELLIYFAILSYHCWCDRGNRDGFSGYVQVFTSLLKEDMPDVKEVVIGTAVEKTLREVFCHNTSSYHNTCSLIAGVCAQEMLKFLTCQYIPLDDVFVYDGIRSVSGKFKVQQR